MNSCPHIQLTKEIIEFVKDFKSDEELLRSGGIPVELLDKAAHGFSEESIKTLMPSQLSVRWKDDLENVKWEIEQQGMAKEQWAKYIDLSEPIDVDYWKDDKLGFKEGFYIQDGHHRYYAAKILDKPLNVNLEIKINPITKLAPGLGYDDFHRCVFKQIIPIKRDIEISSSYLRQLANNVNDKLARNFLLNWSDREINGKSSLSDKENKILQGIRRDGKVPKTKNNEVRKIVRNVLRESLREKFSEVMREVLDQDYKKWKRKNVTIRGISNMGEENSSGARFGRGLYTAFLGNRDMAKKYGKVYFVVGAIPKNPIVVNDANKAEIWIQYNLYRYDDEKYPNPRRFYDEGKTIEGEMLKRGYDGLVIKGREMVNYNPSDDIMYFDNENHLIDYYENNVKYKNS